MGKTRDLFKKIRGIKGKISCKERNGMNVTEAEDIKKILRRGGKNTQKNYTKKCLNDPENHDGVITHLEPDILEF